MKKLEVKDLKENFFEADWAKNGGWLLQGTKEKFNTMTASWGGIGWLWNKPLLLFLSCPNDIRMSSSRKVII